MSNVPEIEVGKVAVLKPQIQWYYRLLNKCLLPYHAQNDLKTMEESLAR